MRRTKLTRRAFLAGGAALAGAGAGALARPLGANDRISIGVIGCGDRASAHLRELQVLAEKRSAEITALCDVWKVNLARAASSVKGSTGKAPRTFTRFGDLLALPDVDAVLIATPDFGHGPILVAALEAGKDVYIEKPMSIDLALADRALEAARAGARVVQVGTQRRSEGAFRAAAREVASGVLGTLSRFSVSVNFNEPRWARAFEDCKEADVDWDAYLLHLPKRPFDPRLLRRWQLYRDCTNGLSGLWMSHYADLCHFLTGTRYPRSAVAHGGIYVWKDGREHTDTFHALLDYAEGFLFDWAMSIANSSGNHFRIHGSLGTLDLDAGTISPDGGRRGTTVKARKISPDPDVSHVGNWLECIRSREAPAADIGCGHGHAVATILAARALDTGRRWTYSASTRQATEA